MSCPTYYESFKSYFRNAAICLCSFFTVIWIICIYKSIHSISRGSGEGEWWNIDSSIVQESSLSATSRFKDKVDKLFEPPVSCVYNCSVSPKTIFQVPEGHLCGKYQTCRYTWYAALHYKPDVLIAYQKSVRVRCSKNHKVAHCMYRFPHECRWDGWREWEVEYFYKPSSKLSKRHMIVQYLPSRPFLINSIYNTSLYPGYMQIVSFFQPSSLFPDGCNRLYCYYELPNGLIERKEALPGDISFVFCPYPSVINLEKLNEVKIRLSYDQVIFSMASSIKLVNIPTELPEVFMSLCAIVRREGANIKMWTLYHLIQGYDRVILYDNNEENVIDEEMERFLSEFEGVIIRVRWPQTHSQSEQCTDCILRFGGLTKWMTIIDVDEFVVPHGNFTFRSLLMTKYNIHPILQSYWVVFGPCDEKSGPDALLMEKCSKIVDLDSDIYPKSTFQPDLVAGMQSIGPHFPRLKSDIGKRLRSSFKITDDVSIYHYKYRTLKEFIDRRLGSVADRIIENDVKSLTKEWKSSLKASISLDNSDNHILQFIPQLKQLLNNTG